MITKNIKKEIQPNEQQQECIDNINGKYLVLAGPGTGKTFTVIKRIENMLNKGINPNKILCLTFSDTATNEMKSRLATALDLLDTGVNIFTFHGFCNEIINEYKDDFNLASDIKIITPALTNKLLKECIDEIDPVEYRTSKNDPYKMLNSIKDGINEIQRFRLKKEEYFENFEKNPDFKPQISVIKAEIEVLKKENKLDKVEKKLNEIEEINKKIDKLAELWKFYELYKNKMEQNRLIDFSDMIDLVLNKFETTPSFLDKVANKYEYILVDEYQDTNKAQNEIIFKIVGALNSQNVFVVGDDDQIVFTFQGAQLDTMENYLRHFADTKVICLKENMRSTQNILDCARCIVELDDKRLENNPDFKQYDIDKKLTAKNELLFNKNTPVQCYKYNNQEQEYIEIVKQIEDLINSKSCPIDKNSNKKLNEIAILAKGHAQLNQFADMLKDKNIPFDVKNGKSIFEIQSSIIFISYLQFLSNPEKYSSNIFKFLLLEPFKINSIDYMKIQKNFDKEKNIIDIIKNINDYMDKEKINDFLLTFEYLSNYQTNETLRNLIVEVGAKTGIFDYFINNEINKVENIQGLKKVIQEAIDLTNKSNLIEFVEYLEIAKNEDIAILTDKPDIESNAVVLSTYHSSKGREFEYVFMPTMMRNNWEKDNGSFKISIPISKQDYKTKEEYEQMKYSDRIKLMYVGMTRAKHKLILSYVLSGYGRSKTPQPSEFVVQSQHLMELIDKSNYDLENLISDNKNILSKKDYDYVKEFSNLIDEYCLKKKSFSPSAINQYLKCPRQYFYDNILHFEAKYGNADSLNFGSLIHETLEKTYKLSKEKNNYLSLEEVLELYKEIFKNYSFSSTEQRKIHYKRGIDAITNYYPNLILSKLDDVEKIEEPVNYKEIDYSFYGIIDRIDKNSAGNYIIYDYKTGSAKSGNMICMGGKKQDYFIQIALYKYFFEKQNNRKIDEVCFIFPEEPNKNLYLKLTEQDCLAVKEKFENAIKEIKNHNFEPSYNKDTCQYCGYRDFCKMDDIK